MPKNCRTKFGLDFIISIRLIVWFNSHLPGNQAQFVRIALAFGLTVRIQHCHQLCPSFHWHDPPSYFILFISMIPPFILHTFHWHDPPFLPIHSLSWRLRPSPRLLDMCLAAMSTLPSLPDWSLEQRLSPEISKKKKTVSRPFFQVGLLKGLSYIVVQTAGAAAGAGILYAVVPVGVWPHNDSNNPLTILRKMRKIRMIIIMPTCWSILYIWIKVRGRDGLGTTTINENLTSAQV